MSRDQRVVAEADAALADQHAVVAGLGDLGDDLLHVPGRQELPLLDVDRAAGGGGGEQQVGLPAEEGGNLQHVDRLGDDGALLGGVHVGQHRAAEALAQLRQDRQPALHAHAALGGGAGAVRLVEGGLVDEAEAQPVGELDQRMGHLMGMLARFQRAGAGDQGERAVVADGEPADGDMVGSGHRGTSCGAPR
jgi:hypothetical protein